MVGSDKEIEHTLREAVLANPAEAVAIAIRRPIGGVLSALDEAFVDAHAEASERFFLAWLDALPRTDRIGAARDIADHYILGMAWLPRAYDKAVAVELRALADALRVVAETQAGYRELSESPDASFGLPLVERYERVAEQLQEIAALASVDAERLMRVDLID